MNDRAQPPQRCVLVVDDDLDLRSVLGEVLEDRGYRVLFASNGIEALELLRSGARPDVILLDLMMPIMNGWQFLARRGREPEFGQIPVVAISAVGSFATRTEPTDAQAFLRKPVSLTDLLGTVARCCGDQSD